MQHAQILAAIAAGALSVNALAQDYRYRSADEPPRQYAPQPVQSAPQPSPATQQVQPPGAPAALCLTCGTVDAINIVEKPGEGSPVGLIAGGLLGGLLGHQVGQGRGNTVATIVGAAGGAYAGHQVEKNARKSHRYDVSVRMDDGTLRSVSYDFEPGLRISDKVRFVDGRLTRI